MQSMAGDQGQIWSQVSSLWQFQPQDGGQLQENCLEVEVFSELFPSEYVTRQDVVLVQKLYQNFCNGRAEWKQEEPKW